MLKDPKREAADAARAEEEFEIGVEAGKRRRKQEHDRIRSESEPNWIEKTGQWLQERVPDMGTGVE